MRFFLDQCVPGAVSSALRAAGHEVLLLREHIAKDSPDGKVLEEAQEQGSVLVSLNGDFSDIVAYPPARYGGIVALQVRNRPEAIDAIIRNFVTYLDAHPAQERLRGTLILVEAHRIRVRS